MILKTYKQRTMKICDLAEMIYPNEWKGQISLEPYGVNGYSQRTLKRVSIYNHERSSPSPSPLLSS